MQQVERKCDSCGAWVQGTPRLCPVCGEHLDHKVREMEAQEVAKIEQKAREQADFESKHPVARVFIRIFKAIEFAFISVIGAISAFLFWLAG